MLRFTMKPMFRTGVLLADLGLRGERRVSRFVNDTYHSLDGRFSVISRDVWSELRLPSRFYPTNPEYNPHFVELWADGRCVAKVRDLTVAINWILLKVRKALATLPGHAESETTQEAVLKKALRATGWRMDSIAPSGSKDFGTAVGTKQAIAYLAPSEGGYRLMGEYWSQGNNCLSTISVFVPENAAGEVVNDRVGEFNTQVNAQVADTYAVRLLRKTSEAIPQQELQFA